MTIQLRWGMLLFVLSLGGCGGVSESQRDNRRLLEAILTAISLRNEKELLQDEALLEQRRSESRLSEESFQAIQQIVAKAKAHDWQQAENELYEYRKATPFPN